METDVSLGVGVGRPIEHPVAASAVGHAQDYIVNGHNASKAEAQFLASYKCWYVLDVQLCD
jgi:hypothetical protein